MGVREHRPVSFRYVSRVELRNVVRFRDDLRLSCFLFWAKRAPGGRGGASEEHKLGVPRCRESARQVREKADVVSAGADTTGAQHAG